MKLTENLTFKVATPFILVGIFIIVIFIALNPTQFDFTFYIVMALLCIFLFFYGVASGQRLSMPVKKLLKRAVELSGGDLTARVYLDSKDEFEELAKLFNKIAEELEKTRTEANSADQTVDIKVKARTQVLEDTINALEQKVKNRTIELERLIEGSNALQEEAKQKREETTQLKKELSEFKQKVGKSGKTKRVTASSENA
jgi:methyl-accepting chemotaxis protein